MRWFIFFLLLCLAIILESTITTLPLVFIVLFFSAVVFDTPALFVWSFLSGLVLDTLLFQPLGESSIFFLACLALAWLYERKFEIRSIPFMLVFSFLGSMGYIWLFGGSDIFLQGVLSAGVGLGIFFLMRLLK